MAIEYELRGVRVSKGDFHAAMGSGIMGQIQAQAVEELSSRIDRLRCNEHGTSPTVIVMLSDSGPDFKVSGCCEELKEKTESVIRSLGGEKRC